MFNLIYFKRNSDSPIYCQFTITGATVLGDTVHHTSGDLARGQEFRLSPRLVSCCVERFPAFFLNFYISFFFDFPRRSLAVAFPTAGGLKLMVRSSGLPRAAFKYGQREAAYSFLPAHRLADGHREPEVFALCLSFASRALTYAPRLDFSKKLEKKRKIKKKDSPPGRTSPTTRR